MNYLKLIFLCMIAVSCLEAQIPEGEFAITASSTLPATRTSGFSPDNLMDGGPASWSEGAVGNGIGEYLQLDLMYPDQLQYVMIKNGFGKERFWESNARVKTLKIIWATGAERVIHLKDTFNVEVYGFYDPCNPDSSIGFYNDLPVSNSFRFEILDVYPGSRWEDLCITEIGLNQWYYEDFELPEEYIAKNIFREYFDGVFDTRGNLYTDHMMMEFHKVEITDGYVEQDIFSGDGTKGVQSFQLFFTDAAPASYLISSSIVSEISQESMEGKLDADGEPFRKDSYIWDIYFYNAERKDFVSFEKDQAGLIFDEVPWDVFSARLGYAINYDHVWVYIEKPGIIAVKVKEIPDSDVLYYKWSSNKLVLQ